MGGMCLMFVPVQVRRFVGPLGLSGPMTGLIATPSSPIGGYNPPLTAHPLIRTCNL